MTLSALSEIDNYLEISERLGTGGQPRADQFAAVADAGYDVVINLAMPGHADAPVDEDWLVAMSGLVYVHLPVPWEAPELNHLARFFATMEIYREHRVFVHCIKNMRVAVFIFLYRVCRQGVPISVAEADMYKIWHPDGVWRSLIDAALSDAKICQPQLGA